MQCEKTLRMCRRLSTLHCLPGFFDTHGQRKHNVRSLAYSRYPDRYLYQKSNLYQLNRARRKFPSAPLCDSFGHIASVREPDALIGHRFAERDVETEHAAAKALAIERASPSYASLNHRTTSRLYDFPAPCQSREPAPTTQT